MQIKTKCNKCVFLGSDNSCGLEYDTEEDKGKVFTNNYCRFKRATSVSYKDILDQEKTLALVVNMFHIPEDKLIKTLKKQIPLLDNINEIVIGANCSYSQDTINKIKQIFLGTDKTWSIRIFKIEEEEPTDEAIEHYCAKDIKNSSWFMYSDISFDIDYSLIDKFLEESQTEKRFLEIRANKSSIKNIFAFNDVGGNYNKPFKDKIDEYENSNEAVISI